MLVPQGGKRQRGGRAKSGYRQVVIPDEDEAEPTVLASSSTGPGEEGGPPIRSNIVSSVANITASSGSTPCNARWDVNGAAGSPNEDKSCPKWRPRLFPAPPLPFSSIPLSFTTRSESICRPSSFARETPPIEPSILRGVELDRATNCSGNR